MNFQKRKAKNPALANAHENFSKWKPKMMHHFKHYAFDQFFHIANELARTGKLPNYPKEKLRQLNNSTPHLAGLYTRLLIPSISGHVPLDKLMESMKNDEFKEVTERYVGESIDMAARKGSHDAQIHNKGAKSLAAHAQTKGTMLHIPLLVTHPSYVDFVGSLKDSKLLNVAIEPVLVAFFRSYTMNDSYNSEIAKFIFKKATHPGLNATHCLSTPFSNQQTGVNLNNSLAVLRSKQVVLIREYLWSLDHSEVEKREKLRDQMPSLLQKKG